VTKPEEAPLTDKYTGIFDNLDPSAFSVALEDTPTTAVEQKTNPAGTWWGERGFQTFVRQCAVGLCTAFTASNGKPTPYAVLCNSRLQRTFLTIKDGSENYEQFYHRLHGEAQIMDAHWMFTFFQVPTPLIENVKVGEDGIPANISDEDLERAREFAKKAVTWFAESVESGNAVKQRGLFRIVGNQLKGEPLMHVTQPTIVDDIFNPPQKLA
jgi:hypothetical protein